MTSITYSSSSGLTVPGPAPVPFLGRTANAIRFGKDSIGYTQKLFQTYGPVVSLAQGGGTNLYSPLPNCPGTVFVYGSELVRQVATQHEIYHKHPLPGRLYRRRNDSPRTEPLKHFLVGLFGINNEQHRQHRQLMMPAFHKQRLESYRNDMVAITQPILEQMPVDQPCRIDEVMQLVTLRVATKTLFGCDLGESGGNIGKLLEDAVSQMGKLAIDLLPFDIPGLPYHHLLNLLAELDDEMRAIVTRKREAGGDE